MSLPDQKALFCRRTNGSEVHVIEKAADLCDRGDGGEKAGGRLVAEDKGAAHLAPLASHAYR